LVSEIETKSVDPRKNHKSQDPGAAEQLASGPTLTRKLCARGIQIRIATGRK